MKYPLSMNWVIEYWDALTHEVSYFSSLDGSWRNAPGEYVVHVWLFYSEYTIVLKGTDYYYHTDGHFGGYNDDVQSETSDSAPGYYFWLDDGELFRQTTPGGTRPEWVEDTDVKAGVWVTGEDAVRLGLIGNTKAPFTPELKRYR
jgi:hypothetical protein